MYPGDKLSPGYTRQSKKDVKTKCRINLLRETSNVIRATLSILPARFSAEVINYMFEPTEHRHHSGSLSLGARYIYGQCYSYLFILIFYKVFLYLERVLYEAVKLL